MRKQSKLLKFFTFSLVLGMVFVDTSVLAQKRKRQAGGKKNARALRSRSSMGSVGVVSAPVVVSTSAEQTVEASSATEALSSALAEQTAATNAAQAAAAAAQEQASNATAKLSQAMEDKAALETELSLQKLEAKQNEIALEAELASSELVNKYLKQKENIKNACGSLSSKLSEINKDLGLGQGFGLVGTYMGTASAVTNVKNLNVIGKAGSAITNKVGKENHKTDGWFDKQFDRMENADKTKGKGAVFNAFSTATSAVSTVTNIASAVNLGQASKALESFVGAFRKCKSEAEKLSPILNEMENGTDVPADVYNEAVAIFDNCSKLDVGAMEEVRSKAKAAAVTSGIGAGVSTAATVAQGVQLVSGIVANKKGTTNKVNNFANTGTSGKVMNGIGSIGNLASTATQVATSIISGAAKKKLESNVKLLEQCSGLVNQ